MKRILALIGMAVAVLSLVVGCGQSAQLPKPTYQKMTIAQALKKVHFKVLRPTSFPFVVTDTTAEVETVKMNGSKLTELFLIYQNKKELKMLVETVMNRHVPINSNGTDHRLKLAAGEDAIYQQTRQLSVLFWWTNNQSYALQDKLGVPTSSNTKPFLTAAQLAKVASSVK